MRAVDIGIRHNDDFIVSAKPEGVTFRQVLGYIAMIAGGNARIDLTGRMQIVSYDFSSITDAMNMNFILGSLAGDDTVMIVMRDSNSAAAFCGEIKNLLN